MILPLRGATTATRDIGTLRVKARLLLLRRFLRHNNVVLVSRDGGANKFWRELDG